MMIVITYLVCFTMKDNLLFCPGYVYMHHESRKAHLETEREGT